MTKTSTVGQARIRALALGVLLATLLAMISMLAANERAHAAATFTINLTGDII